MILDIPSEKIKPWVIYAVEVPKNCKSARKYILKELEKIEVPTGNVYFRIKVRVHTAWHLIEVYDMALNEFGFYIKFKNREPMFPEVLWDIVFIPTGERFEW